MKMRAKSVAWGSCLMAAALVVSVTAMSPINVSAEDTAPPGKIGFFAKNRVAKANGEFKQWKFTRADFNFDNLKGSVIEIEVDVSSIDTKIKKRDNHLQTADFFDVEKYPTATLKIYNIVAAGKSEAGNALYAGRLDFDMHGVKKTYAVLPFEVISKSPVEVKGTFSIDRMDFNIGEPYGALNPMSIVQEIRITFSATLPE